MFQRQISVQSLIFRLGYLCSLRIFSRRAAILEIALGSSWVERCLNTFFYIFKLGLKDEGMKKELERDEGNESQEEGSVVDQQVDGLENEFDREFWIKVSKMYDFLNELFFKNLNSEFGLFDMAMEEIPSLPEFPWFLRLANFIFVLALSGWQRSSYVYKWEELRGLAAEAYWRLTRHAVLVCIFLHIEHNGTCLS